MSDVLAFSSVPPEADARTRHTALVLHGVLGSGQNFRGFAKKLRELRPDYRFVLADLRHHGGSHPPNGPDTLATAAEDVETLIAHLEATQPSWEPVSVVIGHSLGGKLALELARRRMAGAGAGGLAQVWVLDSNPGTRHLALEQPGAGGETAEVIRAVRAVPLPIRQRKDVVQALVERGLSQGIASWMTTNLERDGDVYVWRFRLERIVPLLLDALATDLWPFLETHARERLDLRLVIAEASAHFDAAARERVERLEQEGHLRAHRIPNAGHWLHVDDPGALLALLAAELPR